MIFDLKIDNT